MSLAEEGRGKRGGQRREGGRNRGGGEGTAPAGQLGMGAHVCYPSLWEAKAGGPQIKGSLCWIVTPCFRKEKLLQ